MIDDATTLVINRLRREREMAVGDLIEHRDEINHLTMAGEVTRRTARCLRPHVVALLAALDAIDALDVAIADGERP